MMSAKRILFWILMLALLLRIAFIIFYDKGKMLSNEYFAGDEPVYDQIALNFLNGKGFVDDMGLYARRGPGHPGFLAIVYFFFGHSLIIARFIQAVIGALTCLVIYRIGQELFDTKTGLVSAFLCAIYYPFIQQPAYLLAEVTFTFLLMLSIFFFSHYYVHKKTQALFIAALFLGLANLFRTVTLYFSLFILFWICLLFNFKPKFAIKPLAIFILGITIGIGPWTFRNYKIHKAFIPVSLESGTVFYFGNNPLATGGTGGETTWGRDQFLPPDFKVYPYTLEADKILSRLAVNYIITHPKRTAILAVKKFVNMWRPYLAEARLANKIISGTFYILVMILAIFGIIKTLFEDTRKHILLYGLLLYYIIIHMMAIAIIRHRYSVMPILIIFASYFLVDFGKYLRLKIGFSPNGKNCHKK